MSESDQANRELIERMNREIQKRARNFPHSTVGEYRPGGILETDPMHRGAGAAMTAIELARYTVVAASLVAQSVFTFCSAHMTTYATITQGSAREVSGRTWSWCPQCGETDGPRYPNGQPMRVGQSVTLLQGRYKGAHGTIRGFGPKNVQIDARIPTGTVNEWGTRETKLAQVAIGPEAVALGQLRYAPGVRDIDSDDLIKAAEEYGVIGSVSVRKLRKLLLDLRFPEKG